MASEKPRISQRWLMVFFITCASAFIFLLRYNMSVIIVAMVSPIEHIQNINSNATDLLPNETTTEVPQLSSWSQSQKAYEKALLSEARLLASTSFSAAMWLSNQASKVEEQPIEINSNSSEVTIQPVSHVHTFDWDEATQGQILSSYFYGYLTFQIYGGRLCERFGAKWVLVAGTMVPSLLTFLSPLCAYLGESWLIANRILIGSFHALVLSSCYAFASVWMQPKEKSTCIIWINIGFEIGGFVTLVLNGYISSQPWLGWECAFYICAAIPFIWLIPYIMCVYSSPENHPRISKYERKLLEHGRVAALSCQDFSRRVKRIPPPLRWSIVLTSRPVWANVSAKVTGYFGAYLLATKLPAYMAEVHGLSLGSNGLFCAITCLATIFAKMVCLHLSPWLQNKNYFSITTQRKIFQCGAQLITGICLLVVNFFSDDVYLALGCIICAMLALGMQCAGEAANLGDFAQDLTGTIFGFTNTFTCINGIVSPILTGKILEYVNDPILGWKIVFCFTSLIYFVGFFLFAWLADSTPQKWAMATYVEESDGTEVKPPSFDEKETASNPV